MIIRQEKQSDFREVEELIRKAFWNLNGPGCQEHYLAHIMRNHTDFVSDLDYVIEEDERIVANVMYTKSALVDDNGRTKDVLTFGPISVLPEYQRKGYGKAILNYTFEKAIKLGYDAIVIFGNPENYICHGFRSCKHYNISIGDNVFPTALLVKELCKGAIPTGDWTFAESKLFDVSVNDVEEFDKTFEPLKKEYKKEQELFYIYSQSRIV